MKMAKLVGERFRERPSDCVIDSHALMVRGGYMKAVGNGIFSQYAPLRRVTRKIEEIIREEMDAIGGQEVLLPVVLPESLWAESGRAGSVGSELLRFRDRHGSPHVLGMTHEEAAVQLVREYGGSYLRYPFMIYQIQTKFRDEARPRAGLIRVREFTMKDAYSFHTSDADLDAYYKLCYAAYERIFARVGLPQVMAIASDAGMMGGSISHEFMLLTPVGEDTVVLCGECGYRANMEAAECIVEQVAPSGDGSSGEGAGGFGEVAVNPSEEARGLGEEAVNPDGEANGFNEGTLLTGGPALVHTPGMHSIDEVCGFLGLPKEQSCKAVVYQTETDGRYVILFIRGDLEVNETKLTNYLGEDVRPGNLEDGGGLYPGFIGPLGLAEGFVDQAGHPDAITAGSIGNRAETRSFTVLYDRSLQRAKGLCCGGNQLDYHYTGLVMERDCTGAEFHDFAKIREGGICPSCGKHAIALSRGVEVGNIFQLGDKYTRTMGMQVADPSGGLIHPVMGCYGIGIGRLAASVCEIHRDEHGPVWPISIAPWQVHLCCVRADDAEARACADGLYRELQSQGMEVVYDDRSVSAGVMFADADLLGVPIRVIVSPRNLKEGCCEIATRDKKAGMKVPVGETIKVVTELKRKLLAELEAEVMERER